MKNARTFPSTTISPICGLIGRSLMKLPKRSISTPASSRSTVQAMKVRLPEPRIGSIMSALLLVPPMHLKA